MTRLARLETALLFSFLLFFCYALLYIYRFFDGNTLASWKWLFADRGFSVLLPFLGASLVIALAASCAPLEKFPASVLIFLGAVATIPLLTEPELMLDSGRYFLQAKSLAHNGILFFFREWGRAIFSWTDLPLIPFLYGMILKWTNESRLAVQLFNASFFVLAVIITWRTGTFLWNSETGLYAGLFLLAMPYLLTQVVQVLVDIHALFFHLLAFHTFLVAVHKKDAISPAIAAIALAAALLVKYSLWPMLALLPPAGLILSPKASRLRALKREMLILAATALVFVPVVAFRFPVFVDQLRTLFQYQRPALHLWGEGILGPLLFHCHPFILLLALYGMVTAWRKRDARALILLLYLLLAATLQIRRIRYLIPLLPFFALAAAYGLCGLREIMARRFIGVLAVSSALTLLHTAYLPFFSTTSMMNLALAGRLLDTLPSEAAEVVVLPQELSEGSSFAAIPLLDLHTDKCLVSSQAWPTSPPPHLSPLSPLLFTWKIPKPSFYSGSPQRPAHENTSLVIIASSAEEMQNYMKQRGISPATPTKDFFLHSQFFRYKTLLTIVP
ncbi:MAG: hypothetical protein Kow0089_02510 [Desulfobulbaceae bacterium]